ncbi:XRE family transcriptional regulator [Desulfovibrio litoralis]|uniref:Phage repressor protein C, contains Cro/C1-type HTH and peptisase s24 domains n=1 Tax=Desulfovibrio litoralis DSM 11393 TaxID=1121455 RepID=A0A1M7T7T0_9BACT|nr:XRE family transcriptional regulator [Desulfovibrio litoralis]SHN66712.1 Phage repressor protein C, contains Cro/C1-type HTH and peptisase s24 domains [Desulfovibrio litoralis DSM 11393]
MSAEKITSLALKYWLTKLNLKQQDIADKAGITQSHISNMLTGRRGMTTENLEKICDALDITIPEFFAYKIDEDKPDVEFIPLLKARPRAGNGGLETDGDITGWYSFHQSFLTRKGGSVETMRLFHVAGDSMSPTLNDGDMVLINLKQKDVTTGHVYLIRIDDELMIKRLETKPGKIILKSDNPDYEPIEINKDDESVNFEIHGRMVWSCREY